MKKIFTLIAALVLSVSLIMAQDEFSARRFALQSKLTISAMTNEDIKIVIDGNTYNATDNDGTTVNNIRSGYHSIKVYQKRKAKFNERKGNRNMQLIYETNLYIKPQYHVDIVINRFGKAFIDEQQLDNRYYAQNEEEDNDHEEWSVIDLPGMDDNTFYQFKQVIQNESFDNARLTLAKQTISKNCFSSVQVKEIVQLFSFDNSKLEVAKYSYKNTVDKNNYFIINDAFAFSSSKEDLAQYIEAYR